MDKPSELENINATLKALAGRSRPPGHLAIALVDGLQRRRMELIAGPNWQKDLTAWINSAQELRAA